MASDIVFSTRLPFTPEMYPFGQGRALFFCSSIDEAFTTASFRSIKTQGTVVYLSRWGELVNTIDPMTSRFEGWNSDKGLPFNLWNQRCFDRIANMLEGLIDIHQQTRDFSSLTEALIKVKTTGVNDIRNVIHLKFDI